jgi:outer membrane lipoprotein-sorting protein
MSKVWLRWVPAAAAVVVVAGAAIAVPTVANASVSLPGKTPTQVLELVASSQVKAFSGTVEETSDLGLPSLPTGGVPSSAQGSSSGVTSADIALLTGPNSLRVYVDGPTKARVQDLESLAERDVVRNGSDVWVYDSKDNSVAHASLESRQHFVRPGATPQATVPDPTDSTPSGLAKKLIAQLQPTSTLSVDSSVRVAGRAAYDLVLTPKVTDTLIGSVSIAVDAQTGLPLRVQIDARGQKTPAVSIGFSSLDLSTPAASLFAFTPPAGAKVTELKKDAAASPAAPGTTVKKPAETVTGHGWDAVVTVAATSSLGKLSQSPEFGELTTAVTGGRLLHTSLFNILFTTDGRIVAGSVSVARLQEAASAK